MSLSRLRLHRFVPALLLFIFAFNLFSFSRTQFRFQRFLAAHYITWNDFPSVYTNLLRSKDWDSLLPDKFDYARHFPVPTNTSETIPRTIHFIWFKNLYDTRPAVTQIPSAGSRAPELCQKHNPDYDVKIWDAVSARKLLQDHYTWFLPTYDAYKYPIQRIDAIKYFVLWHYGGVYMDLDVACRRPLDPLLNFPAWFPEASPLGVNNDLMASRAKHPAVQHMLDNLSARNRNLIFPYLTIFWSTGPQFTGDMLKSWFLEHPASPEPNPDNWFVLPQDFYSEEYTFFGHSPGGTWHGEDVAVVLWLVAHPLVFWLVVTVLFGACIGLNIWWRRRSTKIRLQKSQWRDIEA